MISSFTFADFALELPGAREKYLALVAKAAPRSDWTPLAFGLMGNHLHWALLAGRMKPASFYHSINTGFGLWVNQQRREMRAPTAPRYVGPVFSGRPSTFGVPPKMTPRLVAYLHNNPVRAGLVDNASLSSWTSHNMYLNPKSRPPWLHAARGLDMCGLSDTPQGRSSFHDLVVSFNDQGFSWTIADAETKAARRQLRSAMGAPAGIASPQATSSLDWTHPGVCDATMPVRTPWRGSATELLSEVAIATRIPAAVIRSRNRRRDVCRARRVAVFAWRYYLGRQQKEIAIVLGVSSSTASSLARRDAPAANGVAKIALGVAKRCWAKERSVISSL